MDFDSDLAPDDDLRPAVARRRRERMLAVVIAAATFTLASLVVSQFAFTDTLPGATPTKVSANAIGVVVRVPGRPEQRLAASTAVDGKPASAVQAQVLVPDDGSLVRAGRVTTGAKADAAADVASSSVEVGQVELLGGKVVVDGISLSARSAVEDGTAGGAITLRPGATLTIGARVRELRPNRQVVLRGVGTLSVNEQAVVASSPKGDAQTGPRHKVVGAALHLRLSEAYGSLPAGTEVVIGQLAAGVRRGKVEAVQPAPRSSVAPVPVPGAGTSIQTGQPKPGEASVPRRATNVKAAGGAASGSLQGYVFPVLGAATYTNDYGAPRASTGRPHEGNDIFAAEGTPLVAPADGTLDRVGWNTIGGYRLWLHDSFGNSFYMAHLSAFSPLAVDGATVKAGDVIGFVGHTGDAMGTPDHVHFEIHPGNGPATNPFPFLNAWKHGTSVPFDAVAASGLGPGVTASPAAMPLLGASDISTKSGLQSGALETVPDTAARPIEEEHAPVPTDDSLREAIGGAGITAK